MHGLTLLEYWNLQQKNHNNHAIFRAYDEGRADEESIQ